MARLLLHIGAHKTATSSVQRRFHLNRTLLAENGIHYPDIGPNPAHHILVTPWIDVPEIPERYFGRPTLAQRLRRTPAPDAFFNSFVRRHASKKGTVFLSAEVFSRAEPQRVDMRDLARRLKRFEDVRIVYTVRHQTDYIQSIWLQIAKSRKPPPFDRFLAHALEKHLASGVWVEHGKVIEHLLTGFAPEQLIVLDYESVLRHPDGVIGPFLELLGSPLRAQDLEDLDGDANISPDPLATWVAHSVCWPAPIQPRLIARLQPALDAMRTERARKRTTLYTREQYQRVIDAFGEANDELAKWLRTSGSEAAVPAPPSPETLLFRDDFSVSDWAALARQVMGDAESL